MEPVEPVKKNIYQSNTYRKDLSWLHFTNEPRVEEKHQVKESCIFIFAAPSSCKEHQNRRDNSIPYMDVWWIYRDTEQTPEKATSQNKLRTNLGPNFHEGSFSNRDNVPAAIKFTREGQPQHLKRWFFLKDRPIHYHINRTNVIGLVKGNQLSFPSIEINKPLLVPVHSVS